MLRIKMLRIKISVAVFVVSCSLVFSLSYSLFAATQQAIIQQVKGKVEVFIDGKWYRAQPGTILSEKNKIRTIGRDSYCTLVFQDGHTLRISGNSEILLGVLVKDKTEIKLNSGRTRAKVKKLLSGVKFGIRTPTAVCAVRGTDFVVEYVEDETGGEGVTKVEVYEGVVSALEETTGREVQLNPGEFTTIEYGKEPSSPESIPEEKRQEIDKEDKETKKEQEKQEMLSEAQKEIFYEISRDAVTERAADEIKTAEYQLGKSVIDAFGKRVRLEEYITRPKDNQFKYVVLNTREDRFDFGKILFTFNDTLPTDLRNATKDMFYKAGADAPKLYLTDVDSVMSNTIDQVNEVATGGRMVPDNPSNPTSWSVSFKTFTFFVGSKGEIKKWWEYNDTNEDGYVASNEISYYKLDGSKINFSKDFQYDSDRKKYYFEDDNKKIYFDEFSQPSGANTFHFYQRNNYDKNQWISTDDYIINDDGKILTLGEAKKWSKDEIKANLEKVNFERVYTSSVFNGRKIDLVFSAKLLVDSGILSVPDPSKKLAQK